MKEEAPETKTIHEIFDLKESDLDQYLQFDRYRRTSFLDHFIPYPVDFEGFRKCLYQEEGNFLQGSYDVEAKKDKRGGEVFFSRSGTLFASGQNHRVKVEKRFLLPPGQSDLTAVYRVTSLGEERKRTNFGIEFNINLLAGDAPDRYYDIPGHRLEDRKLASMGECADVSEIHLVDEWIGMKVVLKMDKSCNLWRFPIETVSLSESGFERIFQGSCLLLCWPLELKPNESFEFTIELGSSI
jgi:alpha-amylase